MSKPYRIAALLLSTLGIVLRLRLYLQNSSLWWDEAALAANVIDHPYRHLLGHLDYQQAAPVGFLYASKAVTGLFGDGEMALRLLPLLCALASVVLFHRLAARLLQGIAVPVAVGLFALSAPLLRFAVDFKPYSVDLLCALVITTLALDLIAGDRRAAGTRVWLVLGCIGIPMVWLSNAASLVLAGAGLTLFLHFARRRDARRSAAVVGLCVLWLLSFVAVYVINLREVAANPYFQQFWSGQVAYTHVPPNGAFMPVPHSLAALKDMVDWLLPRPFAVLMDPVGVPFAGVAFVLLTIGVIERGRERPWLTALLLLPGLIALLLSAAGYYPFLERFLMFFAPALIVMIARGAQVVVDALAPHSLVGVVTLLALLFVDPSAPLLRFREKPGLVAFRPALEFVAQQRTAGERIYVSYSAEPVFDYYAPRVGLSEDEVIRQAGSVFEPASNARVSALLADLDRVSAEPTWLVFAYLPGEERRAIIRELRARGSLSAQGDYTRVEVYHFAPF